MQQFADLPSDKSLSMPDWATSRQMKEYCHHPHELAEVQPVAQCKRRSNRFPADLSLRCRLPATTDISLNGKVLLDGY
ncbi:hypothetical protein SSYIS1_17750 [Serratia symbiotica]|uniref:Uncharacterized protein n=1 Tax=Serratia symbiotica TaxID=138074 RepID=A0A455VQF1_9GAMM|nr:hypothetical protein SSYIS1_17750 [Serratia symbiotica]